MLHGCIWATLCIFALRDDVISIDSRYWSLTRTATRWCHERRRAPRRELPGRRARRRYCLRAGSGRLPNFRQQHQRQCGCHHQGSELLHTVSTVLNIHESSLHSCCCYIVIIIISQTVIRWVPLANVRRRPRCITRRAASRAHPGISSTTSASAQSPPQTPSRTTWTGRQAYNF